MWAKSSSSKIVWTVAVAIILLTKLLYAVTVHGYMEENDLKSTCGGTRLEFKIEKMEIFKIKIWHVEEYFIQNLTRVKNFFQNLTRLKKYKSKSDALYFHSKSAFEIVSSKSCWNIVKVLPTSKNNLLEIDDGLV